MEQRWLTPGGERSEEVMIQSDVGMWSGIGPDGGESLVERSGMEDMTQLWVSYEVVT